MPRFSSQLSSESAINTDFDHDFDDIDDRNSLIFIRSSFIQESQEATKPRRRGSTLTDTLKDDLIAAKSKLFSTRFVLAYMGFAGFFLVYAMRIMLSVAIVDMVKDQEDDDTSNGTVNQNCPLRNANSSDSQDNQGSFDWSTGDQAIIIGAFFYGYLVTQIPGGLLSARIGGKVVYGTGVFCAGVCSVLIPPASYLGAQWLIALRILQGMFEGVTYPALNHLMGCWTPKFERSFFSALASSGGIFGNVITQTVTGYLCTFQLLDGWPLGFFIVGFLCIFWAIGWVYLVYDSPDKHPRISESEKMFIKTNSVVHKPNVKIPWKQIFTSGPVYGLVVAQFCGNFISYGIMNCLPQYLSNVQNFDISTNGFISSLPWLCCWFAIMIFANITDYLRSYQYVTTTIIRKVNQIIATAGPATFLILTGYAGCNSTLAIFFIVSAMFLFGANWSAYNCNNLDLAPNFAGVIFSLSNCLGTIPGFMTPVIVGKITESDIHDETLWQTVFYVFAGVALTGGLSFLILGSGKMQPWAIENLSDESKFLYSGHTMTKKPSKKTLYANIDNNNQH